MKENEFLDGVSCVESDVVEHFVFMDRELQSKQKRSKRTKLWLRIGALAACLALIVTIAAVRRVPSVGTVQGTDTVTYHPQSLQGNASDQGGDNMEIYEPAFDIQTVLEVEVAEVLPDAYYNLAWSWAYNACHVVKLRVVDQIRGAGLPEYIYLCYPYYDTEIFSGYDRFIMSLEQVGIENYVLINQTEGKVEYFPNMFEVPTTRDLGHGCVIAFRDGKVDAGFWDRADHLTALTQSKSIWNTILDFQSSPSIYPASRHSTLAEVKENILLLANDEENWHVTENGCDYVTADDVFVSEQAREIREYVQPDGTSVFMHTVTPKKDRVIATYTRLINGVTTEEIIWIGGVNHEKGHVTTGGVQYTADDLAGAPDIGSAIARLDLARIKPPHMIATKNLNLDYVYAEGTYRKVGGKVYGIVRVTWRYSDIRGNHAYQWDDRYYLFNPSGRGRVVSGLTLRMMLGNDVFIQNHSYLSMLIG